MRLGRYPHIKHGVQRTTTPRSPWISEPIAHSWDNRLETVRVSHWPITWPIYFPYAVAQGQSHCASNTISNSHPFHSKWVDTPIPEKTAISLFYLENPRKVKVIGEVKVQSHKMSIEIVFPVSVPKWLITTRTYLVCDEVNKINTWHHFYQSGKCKNYFDV